MLRLCAGHRHSDGGKHRVTGLLSAIRDGDRWNAGRRNQAELTFCKPSFVKLFRMSNRAAVANVHPSVLPGRPSHDPVMRREIVMLRAELEEMRATTHEVRKTNQLLHAYIDYILENQYQWQREAERLSSLLKRGSRNPHWSPFSWGERAGQNDKLSLPSLALTPSCADPGGDNLRNNGQTPHTKNAKIVCHGRSVNALRRSILWISFCLPLCSRTPACSIGDKLPAVATL
jgi:hypothetical protein